MKREPVELLSIKVKCPVTGKKITISPEMISFRGSEWACDLCGSHGKVDLDIGICPACGKTHPVTVLQSF